MLLAPPREAVSESLASGVLGGGTSKPRPPPVTEMSRCLCEGWLTLGSCWLNLVPHSESFCLLWPWWHGEGQRIERVTVPAPF